MADIVSKEERSRMMSGVRSKNTKPEMLIRQGLHALGFRFRLHDDRLPGKPDLILPRYKAAILVHGCFWHGHNCALFKWPTTRPEFWRTKIEHNKQRDLFTDVALTEQGWRIARVWECALKGPGRLPVQAVIESCAIWLKSGEPALEVIGFQNNPGAT